MPIAGCFWPRRRMCREMSRSNCRHIGYPQSAHGRRPALHEPKAIADLAKRFTSHLIHQRAHQKNASPANPQLAGVQTRHLAEIERLPLVEQGDRDGLAVHLTLDLEGAIRSVAMGMPDNVGYRFAGCQHHGMDRGPIHLASVANGLHERANDGEHAGIAGHGQSRARAQLGSHPKCPPKKLLNSNPQIHLYSSRHTPCAVVETAHGVCLLL